MDYSTEKATYQNKQQSHSLKFRDKDSSKTDLSNNQSAQSLSQFQNHFEFKPSSSQQKEKQGDKDSTLAYGMSFKELTLEEFIQNTDKRNHRSQLSIVSSSKSDYMNSLKFAQNSQKRGMNISRKVVQDVSNEQSNHDIPEMSRVIKSKQRTHSRRYGSQKKSYSHYTKFDDFISNVDDCNDSENKLQASIMEIKTPKQIWQKKWIKILFLVSKMRKIAHQCAVYFRPQLLNKFQVELINDIGSNQEFSHFLNSLGKYELSRQYSYSKFRSYLSFKNYRKMVKCILNNFEWLFSVISNSSDLYLSCIKLILKYFPLFHYLSSIYVLWEVIIFVCSTVLFLYIPFEFSFQIERHQFFEIFFRYICPIIFGFNIFIRANTKSTENSSFIENHIQIFHKYLKSDMIPDVLSVFSLNYQFFGFRATQFFFFIRITRSFRVLNLLREKFLLNLKISGILSLLYLISQVLFYIHLVSCVWYKIGNYGLQYEQGWIQRYQLEEQPIHVKYLNSFYYSVITMTTIGYGDLTPQSNYEKLAVIFIAFISSFVFGYSINSIGNILSDFKMKNDIYLQEVAKINKYFKQYQVDLELQARSRQYLDYIYSGNKEEMICSIDQLSSLSQYLRDEIRINIFTRRLKQFSLFSGIFSDETLQQIALKMNERIYSPYQNIIDHSNNNENMLFVVHSGVVSQNMVQSDNRKREITVNFSLKFISFIPFVKVQESF